MTLTTEEQATKRIFAKVGAYLSSWPDLDYEDDGDGWYSIPYESTVVLIHPKGFSDGHTSVTLHAGLVDGVEESAPLYRFVATRQPFMGQLAISKGDGGKPYVALRHWLAGDYLDEAEFRQVVTFFASLADDLDDEIQTLFGGKTHLG